MELEIIIVLAVLLVLAIVAPLFSPFFRKPELPEEEILPFGEDAQRAEGGLPPVSIIITDHDNAYQLSQVIDSFLTQDYPAGYQLVVVVDETDHESIDVLEQHSDNPHLYYTKLPVTSRYLSRKKLAMTVGIRAAKYEWCIVTSVYCSAPNDQWLRAFCSYMVPNSQLSALSSQPNLVIGMTPYERHTPRFWRYEHLRTMLYHLRSAEHGPAFSTNQLLVALKKEDFFRQQGFSGNLEYQRAEFEFLVNKFGNNATIAIEPSAWLSCKRPTTKQWYYRHMHGLDSFKDMRHSLVFRLLFHMDLWMMHIYNLLTIATIVVGALAMCGILSIPELEGLLLVVVPPVLWLVSQIIRMCIYKKALRYFHNVGPLLAIIYDWFVSLRNFMIRIRYKFTNKYDFMTHRL